MANTARMLITLWNWWQKLLAT